MGHGHAGDDGAPAEQTLWEELELGYEWRDLVLPRRQRELLRDLPAELRDLAATRVGYRHREPRPHKLTLLFSGPSGTGKTMAAQVLGAALGVAVVRMDLGQVGLLGELSGSGAVVVFDCDRDDGALAEAIERSYRYPGIAVFEMRTTGVVDPELARRFDFAVEFPVPDRDAREQIWRNLLPRDARVTEAQVAAAASRELTGAMIWSCCAAAVAHAAEEDVPVRDRHVARALESSDELEPARPVAVAVEGPAGAEPEVARATSIAAEPPPPARAEPPPPPARAEPPPPPPRAEPPPAPPEPAPEPRTPPPPPSERPRARPPVAPSRRSRRPAVLALAATVAAAALGFAIAHGGGSSHPRARPLAATVRQPPQQNVTYARQLNAVIGRLNAVRSTAGAQLEHARDARAQAAAASQLAAAHAQAASALLTLSPGSAGAANAALAATLRSTSGAYAALARAASHGDARGYSSAQASLGQANAKLSSAFAELGKLGYSVG